MGSELQNRKRGVSSPYRHGQIAKSTFGLGSIATIFADADPDT